VPSSAPVQTLVDTHLHAWPPEVAAAAGDPTCRSWDDAVEALDLGSLVQRAALVTPAQPPGDDHWTASTARASNGMVTGVVRGDHLGSVIEASGSRFIGGVRIVIGAGATADPEVVLSVASVHKIAVCVQNPTGAWDRVAGWAKHNPGQAFLVDHLGHPDLDAGVEGPMWQSFVALARFRNVAVKYPSLTHFTGGLDGAERLRPYMSRVLDAFGPGRLLWASDWPKTGDVEYRSLIETGIELLGGLREADREAVLAGNALRLLWGRNDR
jgi:predicted TIM-barrel fold metal-dependent hydrolase